MGVSFTFYLSPDDNAVPAQEEEDDPIFDQNPVKVACPHCRQQITTFIEHESSWVTLAVCLVLFLVLNWAALCIVPIVYPLFKDVVHHCPRCLRVLATRSRVVLPKPTDEVMSFRIGSCAMVLARKYVVALLAMMCLIGGIHWMRRSASPATGIEAAVRTELSDLRQMFFQQDFIKDCGFKTYLGNPIHVSVAFNEKFKNKTVHWQGNAREISGCSMAGSVFGHESLNPARNVSAMKGIAGDISGRGVAGDWNDCELSSGGSTILMV
eukprot:s300_g9.t1